jgi:hypothetical protein
MLRADKTTQPKMQTRPFGSMSKNLTRRRIFPFDEC